ncbi:MAG: putative baseplate assembly protein [Anaerolineae bacterium]|nr:putative baseplate assembly protein [Anaerolineae bacterium]
MFLRRMLDQVGIYTLQDADTKKRTQPLARLKTRAPDDPTIALLDASAVMADVLTFYQERIANEGFLRTATERRSILELARAIGYELNPGVAATAYLAFTVEDAQGAPGVVDVPAGTRVQSIPSQGQMPQTFETVEAFTAHKEWNVLRPRLSQPQNLTSEVKWIYLSGTSSKLKVGDRLLIDAGGVPRLAHVLSTNEQPEQKRTVVKLDGSVDPSFSDPALQQGTVDVSTPVTLGKSTIDTYIRNRKWTNDELNAFLIYNNWDKKELLSYLENDRKGNPSASGSVYALRTSASFFGNNALRYASLPTVSGIDYGASWDSGWEIWRDHGTTSASTVPSEAAFFDAAADVYLERTLSGLVPGSWAVLETTGGPPMYCKLASIVERSLTGFAMSGRATGLKLQISDDKELQPSDKSANFTVRETTAYLQSEELPLAELPQTDTLTKDTNTVELDGLVLGLSVGQAVTLTGERTDLPGVLGAEILIIEEVTHKAGFTKLRFEAGWRYKYKRDTVSFNANTVRATHGETANEILGSGSGALANQQFMLKKPPLTHIPAATPSGSASTLQLCVNNLLWSQVPSLYGLGQNDESYIIRIGDDSRATVIFGDGEKGARPPTGENNITVVYRSGIGLVGEVDAGSLTLLPVRPLGVRSVVNPLAASGAADPENTDGTRSNAPRTVRTLDRIVSLQDYEDFANAFAGIGKAQAVELWSGGYRCVHLTIAGADERPVEEGDFSDNFIAALGAAQDPTQMFMVSTFELLLFNLSANVAIDNRYVAESVFQAIYDVLVDAFSFPKRSFGQSVTSAEVVSIIQNINGVIYVDLDLLYLSSDGQALHQALSASIAHITDGAIREAQLLLINTAGITLQEVSA